MTPVLVGTSHGTDDADGRAAVRMLLDGVRAARPELDVREAFVDVQTPEVDEVLATAVADAGTAVVVPLLLSTGYHVRHDIARAVAAHPGAAVAADPLGPDPRLVDLLADRLGEIDDGAGLRQDDAVVLAAAGSSVPAAAVAVEAVAAALADRLGRTVTPAYGAGARPRVPAAVADARTRGSARRVVAASYLLAPGYFHDRVLESGADVVTAPLAPLDSPDPRLTSLILSRYAAATPAGR